MIDDNISEDELRGLHEDDDDSAEASRLWSGHYEYEHCNWHWVPDGGDDDE
jgi:hypothetical protein